MTALQTRWKSLLLRLTRPQTQILGNLPQGSLRKRNGRERSSERLGSGRFPATAVCPVESSAGQSSVKPPLNPCTSPAPAADGAKFVGELPLTSGADDVIESQASKLTDEGLKLAAKGSTFSAQAKYIEALQLIAVSLDAKHDTECHAQDLTSGLLALREADDFAVAPIGASQAELDPATISVAHTTPLLKTATRSRVTRLKALQLYYSYATKKFVAACGGLPEASRALSCLGRLQPFLSEGFGRKATLTEPKALAFYQAAVMVDPKNFIAANELGVVLRSAGNSIPREKPCCIVPLSAVGRKHFTISRSSIADSATTLTPNGRPEWPRKSAARRATVQPRRSRPRWSIGLTTRRSSHGRRPPTLSLRRRRTDRRTRRRHFRRALPSKVRLSRVNPRGPGYWICCSVRIAYLARSSATSEQPSPTETADNSSQSDNSHLESGSYLTPGTRQGSQSAQASVVPISSEQNGGRHAISPTEFRPAESLEPFSWEVFAQGEYIGPARLQHVPEYYLRVDDGLEFVFRLSGKPTCEAIPTQRW